ncbi:MAG: glutamate--cysteine ligase [Thiotrichales bacterium]|nr:MAG: glutamate--cysteine ligase [Thiotrichales bacterium]
MYQTLNQRLHKIESTGATKLLKNSLTGLEKESLRVNPEGTISSTSHPEVLGSALKNPWITTDYGEAMLELITPPCDRAYKSLDFLLDIETFVYQHLSDNELLWTSSMPCMIRDEKDIVIAQYGKSNAGKMKSVYRQGLAERYGKIMQVIAGIHFNYSVAVDFWPAFQEIDNASKLKPQEFIDTKYMGMTRNIQRYGWIIPYLFGTSPAICKSFLAGKPKPESMKVFNEHTYYEQWGTSLRMGDIGYTNKKEDKRGIKANYNSLENYISSLRCAINTPFEDYKEIGLKDGEKYLQLNTNILQIENEYYSSVRPKRVLKGFEKPTDALESRGIQYVELRSVDINAFKPAGLTHTQLYFLEIFMLFCLLQESPEICPEEAKEIDENQSTVAHQGRKPELTLLNKGKAITLKAWATQILDEMSGVANLLNSAHDESCYTKAILEQMELVNNPDLTPSAKVLDEIINRDGSYYHFAKRLSEAHRDYFMQRQLTPETQSMIEQMAIQSLQEQRDLEAQDTLDFDTFLHKYFTNEL